MFVFREVNPWDESVVVVVMWKGDRSLAFFTSDLKPLRTERIHKFKSGV